MPRIPAQDLEAHRARVEADLLAAVEHLLDEHGPDGVTVAAAATRAGMARSTAYGYAPDRAALLAAVARRRAEAAAAGAEAALAGAGVGRLAIALRALGAAVGPALDLGPDERALAPVRDVLARELRAGMARGELRAVPLAPAVDLVVGCLGAERAAVRRGATDVAAAAERAAAFATAALRP